MAQSPDIKPATPNSEGSAQAETDRKVQSAAAQGATAERSATGTAQSMARQGASATQQATHQMGETMRQSGHAAAQATQAGAQLGAETALRGSHTLAEGHRQIMEEIAGRFEMMGKRLAQTMQESSANLRSLAVPPPAATAHLRELQEGMAGFVGGVVQSHVRATREFFRLTDPMAVFNLQRRFMREYTDSLMQGTGAFLRVSRQSAEQAWRPIESRIEERQHRHAQHENGGVVSDVMSSEVRLINPEDTVQQASRMMREEDTGVLPVGEGDRLVGIVTDRDVTLRLVAEGKDPTRTKVREVMSQEVKYVFEDESLDHAADNMAEQQVRRLPVVNRNKRLVGVVSLGDLSRGEHGGHRAGRAMRGVAGDMGTSTAAE